MYEVSTNEEEHVHYEGFYTVPYAQVHFREVSADTWSKRSKSQVRVYLHDSKGIESIINSTRTNSYVSTDS